MLFLDSGFLETAPCIRTMASCSQLYLHQSPVSSLHHISHRLAHFWRLLARSNFEQGTPGLCEEWAQGSWRCTGDIGDSTGMMSQSLKECLGMSLRNSPVSTPYMHFEWWGRVWTTELGDAGCQATKNSAYTNFESNQQQCISRPLILQPEALH